MVTWVTELVIVSFAKVYVGVYAKEITGVGGDHSVKTNVYSTMVGCSLCINWSINSWKRHFLAVSDTTLINVIQSCTLLMQYCTLLMQAWRFQRSRGPAWELLSVPLCLLSGWFMLKLVTIIPAFVMRCHFSGVVGKVLVVVLFVW